jgi:hypothetical protein
LSKLVLNQKTSLKPEPVFLFIGVKLKLVSETHQTTSGCGFGGLTSVQMATAEVLILECSILSRTV